MVVNEQLDRNQLLLRASCLKAWWPGEMAAQHGIDLVTTTKQGRTRPQVGPQFFTAMQSRIL
eukprot:6456536-Amphidinium_carterae.1